MSELERAAVARLETEASLSRAALTAGSTAVLELDIVATWAGWYLDALTSTAEIEVGGASPATLEAIASARKRVENTRDSVSRPLRR